MRSYLPVLGAVLIAASFIGVITKTLTDTLAVPIMTVGNVLFVFGVPVLINKKLSSAYPKLDSLLIGTGNFSGYRGLMRRLPVMAMYAISLAIIGLVTWAGLFVAIVWMM